MSRNNEYKSVLAPFIKAFIELKEAAGIDTRTNKSNLLEIDRFCFANNMAEPVITREIIEQWRKSRMNDGEGSLHNKYSLWAQLARFMIRHGYDCYVPQLPRYTRSTRPGYAPYIFTHKQIEAILNESGKLIAYKCNMSCSLFCIPAVLRLLYSTGLRVSEALLIRNSDVRMDKGYIHIRKTKNGCERMVPINENLKIVLQQYLSYRDKIPIAKIADPNRFFFIKPDGSPCIPQAVYKWFRKLLPKCNIPFSGNCQGPRVHDIRHTMAVHSLEQMVRNGIDLYASMPIISTCLGHKSLSATEQYVRLTYEMFPELAEQCSAIASFVYPRI
jgi:Site-specific recombinase XerD